MCARFDQIVCGGPWHSTRRGETARGQAWVCAAAAPLGRRAQFRVGGALSSVSPGLRAVAGNTGRLSFPGICHPHAHARRHANGATCITHSRAFMLMASGIHTGEAYSVGVTPFRREDGATLDPVTTKPEKIRICSDTPYGRDVCGAVLVDGGDDSDGEEKSCGLAG
jgi:hypothetical protein